MARNNINRAVFLIILSAVMIVIPFTVSGYKVDFLTMLLVNVILAASFRLITTTGGWSLAHVPMMGAGAYATALMSGNLGIPFWFSLPLAGLTAGLIGLAISIPLRRTEGFAFFVASFAAGEALRLCWIRFKVPFGGHQGLAVPPPELIPDVRWLDFSTAIPYYFLTLVVTVLCLIIMYRLDGSRIGSTFKAIHSEEKLAKSMGINAARYKMLAMAIGSFFAGIAGVLLAHRLWAIEPTQFGFSTTLYLLVWVVFGGTTTFSGPILGVVVLSIIGELLRPLADWVPMVYGIIIILTLIFFPGGLESLPSRIGIPKGKFWRVRITVEDR
jgi:branched-chain amino acid transport system permease protein